MSIISRCPHCRHRFRTPDGSQGKQAVCPSCQQISTVTIADPGAGPAGPETGRPVFQTSPTVEGSDSGPTADRDLENPYAAPSYVEPPATQPVRRADALLRDGPPWEREGKSISTFWETSMLVLRSPRYLFGTMRRQGGYFPPLLFAVIGSYAGALIAILYQLLIYGAVAVMGGGTGTQEMIGVMVLIVVGVIVLLPLGVAAWLYVYAALIHAMLFLVRGNRFGFQTTFRVTSYSVGSTLLLLVVPFCGSYIAEFANLIVLVFGLSAAHEISGAKSAAAVLLPLMLCLIVAIATVLIFLGITLSRIAPLSV